MDIVILLTLPSTEQLAQLQSSSASVYFDKSLKENLDPLSHQWTAIEVDESAIDRSSIQEVLAFGHQPLDGSSLIERLQCQGPTYWYHLKFRIFHRYRSTMTIYRKIEAVLQKEKAAKHQTVKIYTSSPFQLALFFPEYPLLQQEVISPPPRPKNHLAKLVYLFYFLLRAFIGFFQLPTILLRRQKNAILLRPEVQKKIIHPETLNYSKGDHIIEYLLQKTAPLKDFIFISDYYPPAQGKAQAHKGTFVEIVFPKYASTIHFEFFLLLSLFHPATYLGFWQIRKQIKQLPKKHSSAAGSTVLGIVQASLPMLLLSFLRVRAATLLLTLNRPRTLSGTNEHDQFKAFPVACQTRAVPFIAFQHGAIASNSAAYMFSPADLPYHPIPPKTICWGYSWKEVLTQHSCYPDDSIITLGQIRTDIIQYLKASPTYPDPLTPDRPLVLYCSQPLLSTEEVLRTILGTDFFKLSKAFPEVQFVLKPHPLEKNWDFFNDMAQAVGADNFHILDNDLYQLINIADMIITYHSTVGVEAVYFGKPVVVADYNGNNQVDFGKPGIGFKFSEYPQLQSITEGLLSGHLQADPEQQQAMIREYTFAIDGKTTERYIDFIQKFEIPIT